MTDDPIQTLLTRTIDDGANRMEWLRARQGRITASMIGKLLNGGPGARREILEQSFEPPVEITGNRYIDRGHEREPVIAAWIQEHWPTIAPNLRLIHAADNTRHAATPDGIGTNQAGKLVLAEIKTSKYDRDPLGPDFAYTGYAEQMQWQMYVCDAISTLFVWEQHDDDWDNGPTPLHDEPRFRWVRRDEAVITRLVAAADLALAERDAIAAEFNTDPAEDEELEMLATEVLDLRRDKARAEAALKGPWTRLLAAMEERPEFSKRQGRALVTWSNRTEETTVVDRDAALAAPYPHADSVGTGADLWEELQRVQDAWDEHQAQHMKTVQKPVQKLTVTEPKPPKSSVPDGSEF